MKSITFYDPPMCCSTGVCGPDVDPVLPETAAFLEGLRARGVEVSRYNLAQQPMAFVENRVVKAELEKHGTEALPLIFIDGRLSLRGAYPDHATRVQWMQLHRNGGPSTDA